MIKIMSHDHEDNIICPHCDSTYSSEPYEYYDSDGEELECDDCGKKFILGVNTSITFSTNKSDCEDDNHDIDEENIKIRIYDQETCDRYNREKFLISERRPKWEPHKKIIKSCKNCEHQEYSEDLPLRPKCDKGTHIFGKPYGENLKSMCGTYYTRRVDCNNCEAYNYVDDKGNIEFEHLK